MQIAIVGRGFAGLALGYYLTNYDNIKVTFFDEGPLGCQASGISCGLLHPFNGAKSKKSWMGDLGMQTTLELIKEVEFKTKKNIIKTKGILRPAINDQQQIDFEETVKKNNDVFFLNEIQARRIAPFIHCSKSLFIPQGYAIFVDEYLMGLYEILQERKSNLIQEKISYLSQLTGFDRIIFACGAKTNFITDLKDIPIRTNKGQILEIKWPSTLKPLETTLISHVYLSKAKNNFSCFIGATYERNCSSEVDIESAKALLIPKAVQLIKDLENAEILSCKAGHRAFSPDNITPIAGKTKYDKVWVFTGLGSKGLLHHAWIAKELARSILKNDQTNLPAQLYFRLNQSSF
jgi:glycine/D-amino acid oxidase-like deaminating enzyme